MAFGATSRGWGIDSSRFNRANVRQLIRCTFQIFPVMYDGVMPTVKEQVLHLVQRLPDDANLRDVNEEIALLAAIIEAEDDIKNGRLVRNEDMKARIKDWANA
jgi:DNA mismatch repair ATPase MutL